MNVACWTAAIAATVLYALLVHGSDELAHLLGTPFAVLIVVVWAALTAHLVIGDMHDRPDR